MNANIRKLQYLPYGTKEHEKHLRIIQKEIKSRDYILCMHGKFSNERNVFADKNISVTDNGLDRMAYNSLFPSNKTVFESDDYFFVRRDQAEYNLDYRQVNVGLLIVDDEGKVLVLRKKNDFLALIGGHTDFIRESYDISINELTHYNMVKEYKEEVISDIDPERLPKEPIFFVTEGHEMWDFMHAWFIYVMKVDNLFNYKFKSGEKDKHSTVVMDIDEAIEDKKVKNSLKQALMMYKTARENSLNNKLKIKAERPVEEAGRVGLK